MAKTIWRYNKRPYTPQALTDEYRAGIRPSISRLVNLVDTADPAFPMIAEVLAEMTKAGVDLDEATVVAAIKLGKERHRRHCANIRPLARFESQRLWPEENDRPSIVYYIRRGDLIKIGTTVDPTGRLSDLMPDEVLAWEPGGRREEALRHRQFRHLCIGGEYFQKAADLLNHCRAMRNLHGDPDPSWPTTRTRRERAKRSSLDAEMPPPASDQLVTVADAAATLKIRPSTVKGWVHRKRLKRAGMDDDGHALYFLDHVRYLKSRSPIYRETA